MGSNTSEASVIEIVPSDEDSTTETISISAKVMADSEELKRSRNKTPEGVPTTPELCGSPSKRSHTNMEGTTNFNKKEFTCPNCTKTFPSENSLSTHIQHHNLENSMLKNKSVQCKHMCNVCKKSFKNSILLSRHTCLAAAKATHKCNICLTTFQDVVMLNNHKKTHNKQNMLNKTNKISICPTKFKSPARKTTLPRFSTAAPPRITVSRQSTSGSALRNSTIGSALRQSPKKKSQLPQCKECQKVCSSLDILNVHERTHKKFNCITCKSSFASRILLDEHLRTSCVKTASPKVRRSSIRLSRAPLTVSSSKNSRLSTFSSKPMNVSTMKCEPIDMHAKFEDCDKTFRTLTALFKHKVKEHVLHTPDKRVMQEEKKTLHRPLATHGGIPVSDKLRKLWGTRQDLTKNQPVS